MAQNHVITPLSTKTPGVVFYARSFDFIFVHFDLTTVIPHELGTPTYYVKRKAVSVLI